ncbi:MAG: AMP-binding protein [Vulcanimicrobiota bacterium]
MTIGSLLDTRASEHPGQTAIICGEPSFQCTYAELSAITDRAAKSLIALGVQPGERLALWAQNSPEWIIMQFGAAKAGAVLVTINPSCRGAELEFILAQSGSSTLAMVDTVNPPGNSLGILDRIIPERSSSPPGNIHALRLPSLRRLINLCTSRSEGVFAWEDFLAFGDGIDDSAPTERMRQLCLDDVANIQFTSGTTGLPKGVMLTHAGMIRNALSIAEIMGFTAKDTLCLPVPLFHCFGCVLGSILCIAAGGTIAPLQSFNTRRVMETIETFRCTAIYGVPAMFIAELEELEKRAYDLSSLRTGIIGAAICPVELMRKIAGVMGAREICIAYGLTEASPIITMTRRDDPVETRFGTVGRPLPDIEVRIIDPLSGREVAEGIQGEICCRGYNVMKGYYNAPEATARVIDEEGWLHTGDLAMRTAEGNYQITGRSKDMIIRGGENIYPCEIEEFLFTHPDILDANVVGVPSSRLGEEVVAFLRKREGASLTEKEVKHFCKGRIATHKIPGRVFFTDSFPSTASGKVQKFKLREIAMERLGIWEDKSGILQRKMVLTLTPGRDGSSLIFDFIDHHIARWGIGISLLVRAAAVLNEILEMTGSYGLAEGALEASFTFVNFSLALDVCYQGKPVRLFSERPPASAPDNIDERIMHISGYLISYYCDSIQVETRDKDCIVHCIFSQRSDV